LIARFRLPRIFSVGLKAVLTKENEHFNSAFEQLRTSVSSFSSLRSRFAGFVCRKKIPFSLLVIPTKS
jgi:hypothetical protein